MDTVEIYPRRYSALMHTFCWLLLGVTALALLAFSVHVLMTTSEITTGIVLLVVASLWFLASVRGYELARRALHVNGPLIKMTEQYFFDRRISTQPIPWSEIEWLPFYAKSGSIQLRVSEDYKPIMYKRLGDRFSSNFCRIFEIPEYSVVPFATGRSTRELENLFRKYKAPLAKK